MGLKKGEVGIASYVMIMAAIVVIVLALMMALGIFDEMLGIDVPSVIGGLE